MSPSLWPASSCSMRSFTLAAMTSLAVCGLEVEGREVDVAGFVRGGDAAHGVVPPFLNGRAVFAHKHALALAHASRGGKCKRRGSPPLERSGSGVERAERSGGLHKRSAEDWGASCARQGRSPSGGLRRAWFPCVGPNGAGNMLPRSRCGRNTPLGWKAG